MSASSQRTTPLATPRSSHRRKRDPSLRVPLLQFPSSFRLNTPAAVSGNIDLLLEQEGNELSSSLSVLTRRANRQVETVLHLLNTQGHRAGISSSDSTLLENSEAKMREGQKTFERNIADVQHLIEEVKKLEHSHKEIGTDDDTRVTERKNVDRNIEKVSSSAHYLKQTKASDAMSVIRPEGKIEDIFQKIDRIKSNPEDYVEFKQKINTILEQKKHQRPHIDLSEQAVPYRIRLEKLRKERSERRRIMIEEEQHRNRREFEVQDRFNNQRRWGWLVSLGARHFFFDQVLKKIRYERYRAELEFRAVIIIQRAYRRYKARMLGKKRRWGTRVLQKVILKYVTRRREHKKHWAADTIIAFLKDTESLNALTRAVRRYQFSVISIQRFWRRIRPVIRAQNELLHLFFLSIENVYIRSFKSQHKEKSQKDWDNERPIFSKSSAPKKSKTASPSKEMSHMPRTSKKKRSQIVRAWILQKRIQHTKQMSLYKAQHAEYMRRVHAERRMSISASSDRRLSRSSGSDRRVSHSGGSERSPRLMSISREPGHQDLISSLLPPPKPFLKLLPTVQEFHPVVEKALREAFQEYNRESNRPIIFNEFVLPKFTQLQDRARKHSRVTLPPLV